MEDGCGREIYLQGLFEVPYDAIELTMPNDTLLCNGAAAVMELEIEGGQPPYQIQWDDFTDEDLVHVVDPEESTEYEVVVIDNPLGIGAQRMTTLKKNSLLWSNSSTYFRPCVGSA